MSVILKGLFRTHVRMSVKTKGIACTNGVGTWQERAYEAFPVMLLRGPAEDKCGGWIP
jgi:hypothetical protein